jgi:hypothetical protein
MKTFKMLQVEQEFNKLAQETASLSHQPDFIAAEVAFPTKDDIPVRRRQDSEVSLEKDDRNASLALTETPRRPKPTTLDIPARRALQEEAAEAQSPDTPGYASRPLPMSPRGPAFANIPLRRVKQKQFCVSTEYFFSFPDPVPSEWPGLQLTNRAKNL